MNIKPICTCPTCETEITPTTQEVGKYLIQFRTKKNTREHMSEAGKKGARARWGKGKK